MSSYQSDLVFPFNLIIISLLPPSRTHPTYHHHHHRHPQSCVALRVCCAWDSHTHGFLGFLSQPRSSRSTVLLVSLDSLSHHLGPFLTLLYLTFSPPRLSPPAPPILAYHHHQPHRVTSRRHTTPPTLSTLASLSHPHPHHRSLIESRLPVAVCLSSGHSSLRNFQVFVPPAALSRRTRQPCARLAIHPSSQRQ